MRSDSNFEWFFLIAFIAFAIGGGVYNQRQKSKLLALPQKYVIGEVVKKEYPSRGGAIIEFTYILNRTKYKGEASEDLYHVKIGERYFVSVPIITDDRGYIKDEDKGIILFDQPVPDSITSVPLGGWRQLPVKSIR